MKVLLVDDEKQFVSALAERLNMRGVDADWSCSGREAIEKVSATSYDLAVLDVKMPQISGLDLKRKMAEIDPDLRYIFLTGHGSEEEYRQCSPEAECYLVKPLQIDSFIQTMKDVVGTTAKGSDKE